MKERKMRMKRLIYIAFLSIAALSVTIVSVPQSAEARLASNNRRAVVLEAFNALRPSHDGSCDNRINGNCVSSWNYLASDLKAYNTLKDAKNGYGCDSSLWSMLSDGSKGCGRSSFPVSFYTNPGSYGYGTFGGSYGPVGRGGQCKFFANLILYRSGAYTTRFPSYAEMWSNASTDWSKVKEGDVILMLGPPTHTAIVVEIKRDSRGNVTGVDVVDSNWITDLGKTDNREVIGRHQLDIKVVQQFYRIWKGVSYYNEPYVP